MSEMVRRVAKALAYDVRAPESDDLTIDTYWATLSGKDHMEFEGNARAAIEAMREPTAHMLEAGYLVGYPPHYSPAANVWKAMLDAALSEKL